MNEIIDRLKNQPVAIAGLVKALVGLLLAFGAVNWTAEQAGAVFVVLEAFFGITVWNAVSPVNKLNVDGHAHALSPDDLGYQRVEDVIDYQRDILGTDGLPTSTAKAV